MPFVFRLSSIINLRECMSVPSGAGLGWFGWRRIWAFLRGTWLTYEVNKLPCVQKCILGTDPHHHRASIWRLKELNLPVMLTMSETLHRNMRYFVVINYQKILPQHMIVILWTTVLLQYYCIIINMYYYVLLKGFCLSNSLKCTNSRYFLFADILKLFVIWTSFTWYIYFKGV